MKKIFVLLIVLSAFYQESYSQVYTCKDGSVSFFSEAPLENIDATTTTVQCILSMSNKQVAFIIPIRGFKFKKDLMREHFNEKYMESDKYPNATFSGRINEDVDLTKDGTYTVTATGKMKIHGVEKEVTHKGTFIVKNGDISLSSEFNVTVKDYNIEIPKLVFQNIAEVIAVKMNVNLQPYKK